MKTRVMSKHGLELTELGFGGAGIGNLYHTTSNIGSELAVTTAFEKGIRLFDTAPHYGAGLSERRLGVALHSLMDQKPVVSTKVGRMLKPLAKGEPAQEFGFVEEAPFARTYDYSYDAVMRSFEDSIQRLGVQQIDILYMHDIGEMTHGDQHPELFKTAMDGGYKAMDELRSQGLVKSIGLGVNEWQVCQQTLPVADFDCFMVANCFTLLNNDITDSFLGDCVKRDIDLVVAAPFNSGILASGSKNPNAYFYQEAPADVVEKVKQLEAVCERHSVTLGAAAIQYPLRFNQVKTVVLGMSNPNRIETSCEWYAEDIPEGFWLELKELNLLSAIA
jgi:D-threo-aldose 1-dehydrogenase